MQDHYLVAQAQDGGGYPHSCLKKAGTFCDKEIYFIFLLFFGVFPACTTRAEKTQTLGVLLGWVKLKKTKDPYPKNPASAITDK